MDIYDKLGIKQELLNNLIDIFSCNTQIDKVVVFGSRSNGTYKETSDIDICIYSKELNSKRLNIIIDEINNLNTVLQFDIVNYYSLKKDALIKNIDKEGVIIYEKK